MCQFLDEAGEVTKQVGVESTPRAIGARCSEVSPFKGHGEAAALEITQDERVDSADAA